MKEAPLFLVLLLFCTPVTNSTPTNGCQPRTLSEPRTPTRLTRNYTHEAKKILNRTFQNDTNLTSVSLEILTNLRDVTGVILTASGGAQILSIDVRGRLKSFSNKTAETEEFWNSFESSQGGWGRPFRDCHYFLGSWFYCFARKGEEGGVGVFVPVKLNQCDGGLAEIFGGPHRCESDTTYCIPRFEYGDRRGGYHCLCREGFFNHGANFSWKGFAGEDIENGIIDFYRCTACPPQCDYCEAGGLCSARRDVYLKTVILGLQLACMAVTIITASVIFKQRKCKAIASGMWTILETILLGIFVLYSTVVVRFFEPSVVQCLLEPWARELGFVICYGAIILKLYRHLIEFRTRKAHRWIVRDTDLLKYLLIMTMSVVAYLSAYTAVALNFAREDFSLLYTAKTSAGMYYEGCKPLWWDYVTQAGELVILVFGIHLAYASRNAKTPFHERSFLCAAICIELAISTVFYTSRVLFLPSLHPDLTLVVYFIRTQLTTTLTLLLVFVPKFWYQQKQVRSLAQEYSCRLPVDAFKTDSNAHGPLTGNNSDADVGEVTLADMSPDDIRAELKRLYMQLEIFKNKTICRDNPHISKRRGGRKAAHRRFSLQKKGSREKNLHGKHKEKKLQEETTECEPSRTPEDSVCSNEGPSAIYSDLPSTTHSTDHK